MEDDTAKGKGARHRERQQRLAEALRRNLKRRKVQARGRAEVEPGGKPCASLRKLPDADDN